MREIIDNIRKRPKFCVWEITFKCNMRCLHCASAVNEGWSRGEELTLEESLHLCDELSALGCEEVTLSGGEALLRKDWIHIARYLMKLGIRTALISNGFVIDREVAYDIKEAGIYLVALSLDGMEKTHDYIRHCKGSFARVCRAVSYLKASGLRVNFVTHANRENFPELPAIEELAISLGIDVWRIQLGAPLGRLEQHPELVLKPDDLPALADFIVAAKQRKKVTISVGDNIGYFSSHEPELRNTPIREGLNFWCGCSAGCLNIGIESNGNVKGCLSLQSDQFVEGNIRTVSLKELWEKKGNFAYTRDFKKEDLHGYCKDCEYGEICRGGCTFTAFSATGSPHNNPYCLYRLTSPKKLKK
ncbi:MAG TPA: radical SAM protein [Candidatus Kapabacteria bacterium]|nr:radical SAM protein [Candidatus Kapabacteria bacterium]